MRLGSKSTDEIKNHPFFAGVDWERVRSKGYLPPFKPNLIDDFDVQNFDIVLPSFYQH
jgi:hypothetical protein